MVAPVMVATCPICRRPGVLTNHDECRQALRAAYEFLISKRRLNVDNMMVLMDRYRASLPQPATVKLVETWTCRKCGTEYLMPFDWCAECGAGFDD